MFDLILFLGLYLGASAAGALLALYLNEEYPENGFVSFLTLVTIPLTLPGMGVLYALSRYATKRKAG